MRLDDPSVVKLVFKLRACMSAAHLRAGKLLLPELQRLRKVPGLGVQVASLGEIPFALVVLGEAGVFGRGTDLADDADVRVHLFVALAQVVSLVMPPDGTHNEL